MFDIFDLSLKKLPEIELPDIRRLIERKKDGGESVKNRTLLWRNKIATPLGLKLRYLNNYSVDMITYQNLVS